MNVTSTPVAVTAARACSGVRVQQNDPGAVFPGVSYVPFTVYAPDGVTVIHTGQPGENYEFASGPYAPGQIVGYLAVSAAAGTVVFNVNATGANTDVTSFIGDVAGQGGQGGIVPAPAAGDGAAQKVMRADGGWSLPNLQAVRVALSNAQLLALQTTAVNLIPAPGLKKRLVLVSAALQAVFKTAGFTLGNADNVISLFHTGKTTPTLGDLAAAGTMDQSADAVINIPAAAPGALSRANTENLGIDAKLTGSTPALTVGAGSAVVTLAYYTVTLT